MSEWIEKKLTDLGGLGRGKSKHRPRDASHLYGGVYPFIQTGDIKAANHKIYSYSQTYSEAGLAQSKLWPKGTICITIAANIADSAMLTFPACFPDSVLGFIPDQEECEGEFIEYLLQYYQKEIKTHSIGSVQENINLGTFDKVFFKIPSLPTQKAIAEILSSLDDKIELNNQINQNLEALAQALFKQWFMDFEFPNENGEPYKSSGGEMVDSELGEIPKGWEVINLGEVFEFTSGFPFKSEDFKEDGIYRIVTIRNVQDGAFVQKTENGIDSIPSKMGHQIKLKEGDVIVSLTGNVGRTCFVTGKNYLLNQRVLKIEPIRNKELTSFPYFFFRRPELQQHLISISKGTAQLNLSPVEMKNIKIPFQKEFSNHLFQKLQALFDLEIETTKESQQLSDLRDTLLPKLISGELEVSEVNLEPTF